MKLIKNEAVNYELVSDDNTTIGSVFVVYHPEHIEIVNLYVNEEFQNQGYGKQLMSLIFDNHANTLIALQCNAFNNGLNQVTLSDWYERLGFIYSPQGDNWMYKLC
jgi:ribosomal protein S18 acetylase RimI-like enzyme